MSDEPKKRNLLSLKKKAPENTSKESSTSSSRPRLTLGLKKTPETPTLQQPPSQRPPASRPRYPERAPYPQTERPYRPKPERVERPPAEKKPDINGQLEVILKMNELPNWVHEIKKGQRKFHINGGGYIFEVRVRPKTWNKLLQAQQDYPAWTAAITGQLGIRIKDGFRLMNAAVQVYERKIKEQ